MVRPRNFIAATLLLLVLSACASKEPAGRSAVPTDLTPPDGATVSASLSIGEALQQQLPPAGYIFMPGQGWNRPVDDTIFPLKGDEYTEVILSLPDGKVACELSEVEKLGKGNYAVGVDTLRALGSAQAVREGHSQHCD